jgi:hypothetical protein
MQFHPLSVVAASLALAFSASAFAGSNTVENLTVFSATKAGTPQEVLKANAQRLNLSASLADLKLVKTQESLLGTHYHYQQLLHGYPVDGADVVVSIGKDGQLMKIFNEYKPVSDVASNDARNQLYVNARISNDAALDKAWNNMKVQHALVAAPSTELVWVTDKNGFHLAYKVAIAAQMPTGGFVQFVGAQDGNLLKQYSTSLPRTNRGLERTIEARASLTGTIDRASATANFTKRQALTQRAVSQTLASGINGSGFVFDPDPRTTLNTDALTDTSPASAFDAAYFNKPLLDLTVTSGVYKLTGPYVNIKDIEAPNTAPSTTTNGVWTAKRGNDAFDDTNIYFQIDQNQRYIQSLGFTGTKGILNRSMDIDTNGVNGDDNSHFSGSGATGYLAFGHGCVNDSEDADVILHEYGHGIQASINSSWSGGDTGAMGEGFGDYWAGSYSYSTPNGKTYHPEWAFSWDGHSSCWGGRMLNRTDAKYNSTKTYSAHTSVTEGGVTFQSDELWSAPLFQSLVSLMAAGKPRANVDQIILEAHFGLGSGVKMPAMATAIVNAATKLFPSDPTYANTFTAKFQAQGILGSTPPPPPPPGNEIEPNNTVAAAQAITAATLINGTMASSTDIDYFKVTVPAGKTLTATLTPNSSSDYDLYLYDTNGTTQLASSVKGKGLADVVSKANTGTTSKVYYVKAIYYSGTSGTTGTYTLNMAW